jgi:hypothetical protein
MDKIASEACYLIHLSRRMRWMGNVAYMRNANDILQKKFAGNRQLQEPECKWEDNSNTDPKKML